MRPIRSAIASSWRTRLSVAARRAELRADARGVLLPTSAGDHFRRPSGPLFAHIQHLTSARERGARTGSQLNVSALKLELAHFAVLADWLDPAEFHPLAVDGARSSSGRSATAPRRPRPSTSCARSPSTSRCTRTSAATIFRCRSITMPMDSGSSPAWCRPIAASAGEDSPGAR